MAQDVTDHGAVGDGSTDDTQAIRDAADAAGPGGTVYFPAGTYVIGRDTRVPLSYPTDGSWDDLTWAGEDYSKTTIRMAGGQSKVYFMWKMGSSGDPQVDSVTWKQLTIDGNKHNQNSPPSGTMCRTYAMTGTVTMRDCVVKDTYGPGIRFDDEPNVDIRYCHFAGCGMVGEKASHAINPNMSADRSCVVKYCLVENSAGTDIDVGVDGQDHLQSVLIERCVINQGRGALKLSGGNKKTTVKNTQINGGSRTTIGVKANSNTDNCGSLEFREVVFDGGDWPAIDLASADFNSLNVYQTAIKNVDQGDHRNVGIYVQSTDFGSSGTVSVHNVGSNHDGKAVEFTDGSSGAISEIIHDGTSGLGSTGGVTVGTNTAGGSALSPDVASLSDVGPRSSSTTSDSGGTTATPTPRPTDTSTTYGGYNTPAAGTTDWHVPLNENFENIEADVLDLAARLDALEGN